MSEATSGSLAFDGLPGGAGTVSFCGRHGRGTRGGRLKLTLPLPSELSASWRGRLGGSR